MHTVPAGPCQVDNSQQPTGESRGENPDGKKTLSRLRFYIFFSENGIVLGRKTELKMDGNIRKYENGQMRMESRKLS